jgi:hypothetical protein
MPSLRGKARNALLFDQNRDGVPLIFVRKSFELRDLHGSKEMDPAKPGLKNGDL